LAFYTKERGERKLAKKFFLFIDCQWAERLEERAPLSVPHPLLFFSAKKISSVCVVVVRA
jgi:hypothetical protein